MLLYFVYLCLKLLLSLKTLELENRTMRLSGASAPPFNGWSREALPSSLMVFAQSRGSAFRFFPLLLFLSHLGPAQCKLYNCLCAATMEEPCRSEGRAAPAQLPAWPCLASAAEECKSFSGSSTWPSTSCWRVPAAFINEEIRSRRASCHCFPLVFWNHTVVSCRVFHFAGGVTPPFCLCSLGVQEISATL